MKHIAEWLILGVWLVSLAWICFGVHMRADDDWNQTPYSPGDHGGEIEDEEHG